VKQVNPLIVAALVFAAAWFLLPRGDVPPPRPQPVQGELATALTDGRRSYDDAMAKAYDDAANVVESGTVKDVVGVSKLTFAASRSAREAERATIETAMLGLLGDSGLKPDAASVLRQRAAWHREQIRQ
jgi:hypothetical protein